MAIRITCIIPGREEPDYRIAGVGGLPGWTEWERQIIGEHDVASITAQILPLRYPGPCLGQLSSSPSLADGGNRGILACPSREAPQE